MPPFGELADPRVLAGLARKAEDAGFDGFFLWDHVARPNRPELAVCDAWTGLAAVAAATERLVFGTRVTPLSRRRPQEVARQAVALDQLSGGRFVLGVGLGSNTGGEMTRLGEVDDPRTRASMLDESLELICRLWSGERVVHHGPHYTVDGLRFLPRPVQQPRIPIWVAAQSTRPAPLRRAARYDGLCPEVSPDDLRRMLEIIAEHRDGDMDGYEVSVGGPPGTDPGPYARAGATWWLVQFPETTAVRQVEEVLANRK
ncbi:alkanesulfonate monooxygenase SsuD/methylene tetrahydromethanopterin reductase-like flavin-dependent oxidoreductase (luciferase family) [Actinomadura rupiterrae]|nr:alkanesulfonate monooxygenase SsuD/methylene tetrahydromethanopterin reductase-like flavin-dependent oxidoreductase (luciferase family) [Actinomadura rupiterrae]